jgi:undecaprenyl diphosphate synthase
MLTKLIMIIPRHIAFIMDGNGRWAQERGMPRTAGHRAGINKIEHVLRICHDLKIEVVSAFGWSTENWSRPYKEVKHMMNALEKIYLVLLKHSTRRESDSSTVEVWID